MRLSDYINELNELIIKHGDGEVIAKPSFDLQWEKVYDQCGNPFPADLKYITRRETKPMVITDSTWGKLSEKTREAIIKEYVNLSVSESDDVRKAAEEIKEHFGKFLNMNLNKTWSNLDKEWTPVHYKYGKGGPASIGFPEEKHDGYEDIIKKMECMMKIRHLIDIAYGGVPEKEDSETVYIDCSSNGTAVIRRVSYDAFADKLLMFKNKELAEEFLSYPENVDLVCGYYMHDTNAQKITDDEGDESGAYYLAVNATVRYTDDSLVNGKADLNKEMPFLFHDDECGWLWAPTINIRTGKIKDWPKGVEANITYKTCDENILMLYDFGMKRLGVYEGYVPKILCPKERGYGDYIIMDIDKDGTIKGFDRSKLGEIEFD